MDRFLGWIARLVFLFLYVPIIAVVVYSFNASEVTSRWTGLSFNWYVELVQDRRLMESLRVSLLVGVSAALLATIVGFLSAVGLTRYQFKGRGLFLTAVLIPLVIPEIVLGVALLTLFSTAGMRLGIGTIVLGHLIICLPLTTLILLGAMMTLDRSLPEAAVDLGCTPWQTFTRVLFPLTRTPLLAAFLLSFTTSFGNIVISTFTSGVGSTTTPLRVFSLLKTGITPEINALGAVLILATVLIIAVIGIRELGRIVTASPGSR